MLGVCGAGLDKSALDDDACLTTFVQYYGRKAFRRPLSLAEVDDFKAFYAQALTQSADGMAALIGRLVAHPNFYYRFDSSGERVSGTDGVDAVYRLDRWELLSKITFLFWASPPDDALYDLVASSDITQDAELGALIDRVLDDPRADRGVLGFFREWLDLDRTLAPGTDGNLAAVATLASEAGLSSLPATYRDDMVQEVLDLTKYYAFSSDGRLEDILTSPYSFARTAELAAVYGVEAWDGTSDHMVSLPAGQRSGLLTRAAMLASNTEYTRPVIKGKNIRKLLLCAGYAAAAAGAKHQAAGACRGSDHPSGRRGRHQRLAVPELSRHLQRLRFRQRVLRSARALPHRGAALRRCFGGRAVAPRRRHQGGREARTKASPVRCPMRSSSSSVPGRVRGRAQVHGAEVLRVRERPRAERGQADGCTMRSMLDRAVGGWRARSAPCCARRCSRTHSVNAR